MVELETCRPFSVASRKLWDALKVAKGQSRESVSLRVRSSTLIIQTPLFPSSANREGREYLVGSKLSLWLGLKSTSHQPGFPGLMPQVLPPCTL